MKTAFLHGKSIRPDGSFDSLWTNEVPAKDAPLWWHDKGLSLTASGYGSRIPSSTIMADEKTLEAKARRWYRAYRASQREFS